jgi:DMSO reductase anchor subunit
MKSPPAAAPLLAHRSWLRRAGIAGSLFFLAKGLLWLTLPAALAWFGGSGG